MKRFCVRFLVCLFRPPGGQFSYDRDPVDLETSHTHNSRQVGWENPSAVHEVLIGGTVNWHLDNRYRPILMAGHWMEDVNMELISGDQMGSVTLTWV